MNDLNEPKMGRVLGESFDGSEHLDRFPTFSDIHDFLREKLRHHDGDVQVEKSLFVEEDVVVNLRARC